MTAKKREERFGNKRYRLPDENGRIQENPLHPALDLSSVPFVYEHIGDFKNRIIYYESAEGARFRAVTACPL